MFTRIRLGAQNFSGTKLRLPIFGTQGLPPQSHFTDALRLPQS